MLPWARVVVLPLHPNIEIVGAAVLPEARPVVARHVLDAGSVLGSLPSDTLTKLQAIARYHPLGPLLDTIVVVVVVRERAEPVAAVGSCCDLCEINSIVGVTLSVALLIPDGLEQCVLADGILKLAILTDATGVFLVGIRVHMLRLQVVVEDPVGLPVLAVCLALRLRGLHIEPDMFLNPAQVQSFEIPCIRPPNW